MFNCSTRPGRRATLLSVCLVPVLICATSLVLTAGCGGGKDASKKASKPTWVNSEAA